MPHNSPTSSGSQPVPRVWASGNAVPSTSPRLIAVVGPTASGKSKLALELAKNFHGQIVSADSRQVYRYMDIGTAKPSQADRHEIPHHLHDLLDPNQRFDLATFLDLAQGAISGIHAHGQLPILAGGSGQYVWALLEGWQLPTAAPDERLRASLEAEDPEILHQRLTAMDPEAASRIHPHNLRRLVRALEVRQGVGRPGTAPPSKAAQYDSLIIGLTMEREALYQRIDQRVDEMMERGLLEEVRSLMDSGYQPTLPSMQSTGYRELVQHLQGEMALTEAVQRIKYATHRLARRQYMWFRLADPRIRWLDADASSYEQAAGLVRSFLEGAPACDTMPS